ncbi:quinol oxidase subunit 2 [Alicyclobacillus contaminans]|uniref:ubiquinol oxidase subunit II n=1 Tax=Alicyclobacillus contaminans TaxID=392016 RepID=UPI0003FEB1C9|nr:ubiquinol oxidase subunit II [Alicyclobacillus contaminans]GMA51466.1 quinol oxidase subunit 2 [Alicyclobacillus contaminans]
MQKTFDRRRPRAFPPAQWRRGLWLALPLLLGGCSPQVMVFHPVGPVGRTEERLIIISIVLTAIVVVPVILLLWHIVHRYRDVPGNDAPYRPEFSESRTLEVVWWSIPIVIIAILAVFTTRDTFALTRPPEKSTTPLTVEVTSLDWKWLFQYPGSNIATVNYCYIPTNRPIRFILTSNAPMNSFWVPQLGGQEYTMPGMAMQLWLQADKPGLYYGRGAQFSGKGFAHMTFDVHATSQADFDAWVKNVKTTSPPLTEDGYNQLAHPGLSGKLSYSSYPPNIFHDIIMKEGGMYMKHDRAVLESAK